MDENKARLFWLILGQLNRQSLEKIKEEFAGGFDRVEADADPLTLWNVLQRHVESLLTVLKSWTDSG